MSTRNSKQKDNIVKKDGEWDLRELYSSPSDKNILLDVEKYVQACIQFEKKYKNSTSFLKNEKNLKKALDDYEILSFNPTFSKPYIYLQLLKDTQKDDSGSIQALLNKIQEIGTRNGNKVTFFPIVLGNITKTNQIRFLKSPILKKYTYKLKRTFQNAKYNLTEPEENILRLKSQPASNLWVSGVKKQVSKISILFNEKELPFASATSLLKTLTPKKRYALNTLIQNEVKKIADFSESEINAIVINKKINDELRGFKTPQESTILSYQNEPEVIKNLIETVVNNFTLSHRFFKLKAKHLGLSRLKYVDRFADVGKLKKIISFEEGYRIIKEVFTTLDPEFGLIVERYMREGQIDIYPRMNKRGGAYCWTVTDLKTRVLLNQTDDLHSVTTFAHEMGHAIHGELSKNQPPIYQGFTTSVAEVASTLFEMFVFEDIFSKLNKKEKLVALHDKIQDDIQTVFRQIACYNFEIDLHNTIREKGSLTKEEIANLMNLHMKSYLGPQFDFVTDDGLSFVTWSHIRNFFYVYSYAYGQLISKALYAEYKNDSQYLSKIKEFLSAGKSKAPEDIFEDVGIPIRNPTFFQKGIDQIKRDINEYESLLKSK